jgi:hypothetical protein
MEEFSGHIFLWLSYGVNGYKWLIPRTTWNTLILHQLFIPCQS